MNIFYHKIRCYAKIDNVAEKMNHHPNNWQYEAALQPPVVHESYFGGSVRVIEAIPMDIPRTGD
jgi:hypothetical protein